MSIKKLSQQYDVNFVNMIKFDNKCLEDKSIPLFMI
jgi:hypothetical protein